MHPKTTMGIAHAAALLTGLAALLVLVGGWAFGSDVLIRVRPGLAAMVPSTALSFIALAVAILALLDPRRRIGPGVVLTLASGVVAVSVADIVLHVSGIAHGIDALLMPGASIFRTEAMATATATCFLLGALAVLRLARAGDARLPLPQALPTIGFLAASTGVVGHAFDTRSLYEIVLFSTMAFHTAFLFLLLFTALLLVRPHDGWVRLLTGPRAASATARRLLPVVVLGPLLLCLLFLELTRADLLGENFRLSLLAISIVVMLTVAVLLRVRHDITAEARITAALDLTRRALGERDFLLQEVHHRVKNNLQQISAMIGIESARLSDPAAREALIEVLGRVRTLGVVYDLLITSGRSTRIDVGSFLRQLCESISTSSGLDHRGIRLDVETVPHNEEIDKTVAIGLLVNELITNALKHAFPDGREGEVRILMDRPGGNVLRLQVSDNGIGAPPGYLEGSPAAGGVITRSLAAQLATELDVEVENGTSVTVTLKTEPEGSVRCP